MIDIIMIIIVAIGQWVEALLSRAECKRSDHDHDHKRHV